MTDTFNSRQDAAREDAEREVFARALGNDLFKHAYTTGYMSRDRVVAAQIVAELRAFGPGSYVTQEMFERDLLVTDGFLPAVRDQLYKDVLFEPQPIPSSSGAGMALFGYGFAFAETYEDGVVRSDLTLSASPYSLSFHETALQGPWSDDYHMVTDQYASFHAGPGIQVGAYHYIEDDISVACTE